MNWRCRVPETPCELAAACCPVSQSCTICAQRFNALPWHVRAWDMLRAWWKKNQRRK